MKPICIAWFRQDLRIQDNPMLARAAELEGAVLPVFIHAPAEAHPWSPGAASSWWLHHALESLAAELRSLGLPLVLRCGDSQHVLERIAQELAENDQQVTHILTNRLYEPALAERDRSLARYFAQMDTCFEQGNASLLVEPEHISNKAGLPFRVFTPFWKTLRQLPIGSPIQVPTGQLKAPAVTPASTPLGDLELLPRIPWDHGLADHWQTRPGSAHKVLKRFLAEPVSGYKTSRDLPAEAGTSSLSPYLHFGQIGPRQVWAAVHDSGAHEQTGGFTFLSELAWREFAYHLLQHFPHTDLQPMNETYQHFPWQADERLLQAWQRGMTGYPFVDAGMRQLWHTGWMHNRVRMVVASFLVKHLLQPWQDGARWFWDTLVDADLASNSMGWQWVAGSGADAAPYFRIFNPFGQGEKFDPEGEYVRRWVPELALLPAKYIHRPWEAPAMVLREAGIHLGKNYPEPVIAHSAGRARALEALAQIKKPSAAAPQYRG
ncbi:MAG TPA: deoxyribodipyrimidine photo-lyase [Xanthomonadales bacterium]|nr:deoxyribodipyrimidine photo-lyase [Xanthomonadales bacterium]